jgi:hypothetical protein
MFCHLKDTRPTIGSVSARETPLFGGGCHLQITSNSFLASVGRDRDPRLLCGDVNVAHRVDVAQMFDQ